MSNACLTYSFSSRVKSWAKWISLGTKLCLLGGGADTGKVVKMLFLPVSKWFFSLLFFFFFPLSGMLNSFKWSLEFSKRYFVLNNIVLCVFMRRNNAWDILFCHLTDNCSISLNIQLHHAILQVWFQITATKQVPQ